jgi:hypothetical protein
MAKFSMKVKGKEVGPASVYAKPHTMSGGPIDSGVLYKTDPNTLGADKPTPGGMPSSRVSVGNSTREPKSTGIKTRGNGAATKGVTARGPMA